MRPTVHFPPKFHTRPAALFSARSVRGPLPHTSLSLGRSSVWCSGPAGHPPPYGMCVASPPPCSYRYVHGPAALLAARSLLHPFFEHVSLSRPLVSCLVPAVTSSLAPPVPCMAPPRSCPLRYCAATMPRNQSLHPWSLPPGPAAHSRACFMRGPTIHLPSRCLLGPTDHLPPRSVPCSAAHLPPSARSVHGPSAHIPACSMFRPVADHMYLPRVRAASCHPLRTHAAPHMPAKSVQSTTA